ncbi:MAG: DUF998 domain-containing protein [Candidatus Methanomethylophilaceae archaeon]|nr:DUF998 domain-containing protein [Candidatus Methanomethylophilaceae archaeon]
MDRLSFGLLMGVISSPFYLASWIVSAVVYGKWKLGSDSLSSLGCCGNASAEIVFNLGCSLTGLLVLFLGLSLIRYDDRLFRLSGCAVFVCTIALLGIGSVTEDYGTPHMVFACMYGTFAAITIVLTGAGDYAEGDKSFTLMAAILLLICGTAWLTQPFGTFEPIAVSCILTWTFIQSALMLFKKIRKERVSGTDH